MTTTKATPTVKEVTNKEISELELLKAEIAELRNMLNSSSNNELIEEKETKKIQADDYIPVMSLIPHTLNLSTKGGGQGSIKRFTKFGETKNILYRELVDIIENHRNFMEAGYFYILNSDVIRLHGLDEIYTKILTKEKIEDIISTKGDECIELYKAANLQQKEIILELLIEKTFNDIDSINLNIIDKISRDSGVDILEKAENRKKLMEEKEEQAGK